MLTIAGKSLCENCFSEITSEPCEVCGFSSRDHKVDPTALPSGSVLQGRYAVGRVIGKGGFGITYLAYDIKHDEKIAIKEYYPFGIALRSPETTVVSVTNEETADVFKNGAEKFYDEARLVAAFNGNPSIVSVYDFFYENDTVYYTMEYLDGMTLKDYVDKNGVINANQAVFIADKISSALMTAHSSNILHRDISPDNIMICNDGKIKLLDFGAARQVVANASQSLSVILKQGFAPLEQYQKKGRQGPWTDIYSLGTTLYYAMTKDIPDDPMSRFEDDEEFSSNKYSICEPLWEVIRKATMLRIEDRYSNTFELRTELTSLGIEPQPLVQVTSKPKSVLPEGVTAKPYTATMHTQTKEEVPAPKTEAKKSPKTAKGITFKSPKTAKKEAAEISKTTAIAPKTAEKEPVKAVIPEKPIENTEISAAEKPPAEKPTAENKMPTRKQLIAMLSCAAAILIIAGVAIAIGTSKNSEPAASVSTAESAETTAKKTTKKTTAKTTKKTEKTTKKTTAKTTLKNYFEGDENQVGNVNNDGFTVTTTTTAPPEPVTEPPTEAKTTTATTTTAKKQDDSVVTIAGKQYKKDMTGSLDLSGKKLTNNDIKQLKYLTKINWLLINNNPNVTDLSPLASLTGLEGISFNNCSVKDISFTKNMKSLNTICAENNGISDISALADHKKLTDVWLQSNNVKDISSLKNCTAMVNICFTNNQVSDISALSGMTNLKQINFTNCKLKSISALKKLTKIELAYLGENSIPDFTPLANCKRLKELHASNNGLKGNVKALKGLTILEYLNLKGNNFDGDELYEYLCYEVYSDDDSFRYDY